MDLGELTERIERISSRYADELGFERDGDWLLLKLHEELGELTQAHLRHSGRGRAKGRTAEQIRAELGAEFADTLCMLLLLARHHQVDPTEAVSRKWLAYEQA